MFFLVLLGYKCCYRRSAFLCLALAKGGICLLSRREEFCLRGIILCIVVERSMSFLFSGQSLVALVFVPLNIFVCAHSPCIFLLCLLDQSRTPFSLPRFEGGFSG